MVGNSRTSCPADQTFAPLYARNIIARAPEFVRSESATSNSPINAAPRALCFEGLCSVIVPMLPSSDFLTSVFSSKLLFTNSFALAIGLVSLTDFPVRDGRNSGTRNEMFCPCRCMLSKIFLEKIARLFTKVTSTLVAEVSAHTTCLSMFGYCQEVPDGDPMDAQQRAGGPHLGRPSRRWVWNDWANSLIIVSPPLSFRFDLSFSSSAVVVTRDDWAQTNRNVITPYIFPFRFLGKMQ